MEKFGFSIVSETPINEGKSTVEAFVRNFLGFPRETIWGTMWDTAGDDMPEDSPPDTAYTSLALG